MSDIFREVDEALTYDRLRTLWNRHRFKVVATLLLALGSLAAWQAWQYREREQRARSSEAFFELWRNDETRDLSPQEQQDLQGGYRMLWLFARAKAFAERQEWRKAQQALQAVADDGSLPPLYRGYAQIWQASFDIEQGRLEAAAKRLAALNTKSRKTIEDSPALQGLALYLQAAILAAQGNRKEAQNFLSRARAISTLAPVLHKRLQEAERALEPSDTP